MTFRVHMSDGSKHDVDADTPSEASAKALKLARGTQAIVKKVKVLKETRA